MCVYIYIYIYIYIRQRGMRLGGACPKGKATAIPELQALRTSSLHPRSHRSQNAAFPDTRTSLMSWSSESCDHYYYSLLLLLVLILIDQPHAARIGAAAFERQETLQSIADWYLTVAKDCEFQQHCIIIIISIMTMRSSIMFTSASIIISVIVMICHTPGLHNKISALRRCSPGAGLFRNPFVHR